MLDGTQYVTVAAGWGGGYGMKNILTDKLRSDLVLTFRLGIDKKESKVNVLHEENQMAFHRYAPKNAPIQPGPKVTISKETFLQGETVFNTNCAVCHVVDDSRGGVAPNLLTSHMIEKQVLPVVLLDGVLQSRGMPSFEGKLERSEVEALSGYLKTLQQQKIGDRPSSR